MFTPTWKDSHFDLRIFFQMGWFNHQLVIFQAPLIFQRGFRSNSRTGNCASLETSSSRYLNLTTIVYSLGLVVSVLLLRWGRAEEAAEGEIGWKSMECLVLMKKTKLVGHRSWLRGGTEKRGGFRF